MIKHIVMWTLKAEAEGATAAENGKKMKEILEALPGKIDGLLDLHVSLDIFESAPQCDVILYSTLTTKEALQGYAVHPEHLKCVEFVKKVVAERRVLDYVI